MRAKEGFCPGECLKFYFIGVAGGQLRERDYDVSLFYGGDTRARARVAITALLFRGSQGELVLVWASLGFSLKDC